MITKAQAKSSSNIHCNEKDKNILQHFKEGVTNPAGLLSSWSSKQNCCDWNGVHCDNFTGRVTHLNLPCPVLYLNIIIDDQVDDKSHCLTGELDLSLLELEFLSYLNLSNNQFMAIQYNLMGSQKCNNMSSSTLFPYHCGNSSKLRYLDLSYNNDIVIDNLNWISRFSSLEHLNLNGIDLHKETNWLHSMTMLPSLSELHLQSCQLENLNPSLQYANFTTLEVLNLPNNEFKNELPTWLFNLSSKISYLDLSQNYIHGQLPETFPNNLRYIKSMLLSRNNLNGPIPEWLGQLEQLEMLDLYSNSFSGPIPTNLGNLSTLTSLDLESNLLNGNLPESLGQLFNLEFLGVGDDLMTGFVSEKNFLSLSNLKTLSITSLEFQFDPEWIPPFELENLYFNYMVNKLPSWLFTQGSLQHLIISNSRVISFEPLDMFWHFTAQLEYLYLKNNSINGDMSNVFLNSKVSWLISNNLRGGLPRLSPNVTILDLEDNSISGSIAPLLCHSMIDKSNLRVLALAGNLLSGELTNCWKDWKSLAFVMLGGNNLTGKIPHSIGSLSKLVKLDLSDNKFYGDIPMAMKNCKDLLSVDLAYNNFSGPIPSWVGQRLKALQLRSNQFTGIISPQICQLNHLQLLDFGNNKLSGSIPDCLRMTTQVSKNIAIFIQANDNSGAFITTFSLMMVVKGNEHQYVNNFMNVVDLSSNKLSGIVPPEIFMLTGMLSLNLSHNQLFGRIPEEIGNMKQLESIDLSSNQFSGVIPQSMSALTFLDDLNLSFNNFMGKIPTGTQLQSFTELSYMGNPQLCGPPLVTICPQDEKPNNTKPIKEEDEDDDDDDESEVYSWFYMGMGIGFAVGFLTVVVAIFFSKRCRHAYFRFLDRVHALVIEKINSVF